MYTILKIILTELIICIAIIAFLWIPFAYVSLEINPLMWSEKTRYVFAILITVFTLISIGIEIEMFFDSQKINEEKN